MADFTLEALKDEIVADTQALGYKNTDDGWTSGPNPPKGDQEIADLINNADGLNPFTVDHTSVDTGEIRGATTFDAFAGLTAAEEAWFSWLTQNGVIPVNADTLMNLAGIGGTSRWATGDRPTMEPRMAALMQFQGSRAEVLWGEGVNVSAGQVGAAFNLV